MMRIERTILKINPAIKAVIFDMDGVITNTMPDHFRAWKTVLGKEGIHVTHFDVYKREGQRGLNSILEICADYGQACPPPKAERLLKEKEELFKRAVKVRFITGARRFIRSLHRQGLALALVTGTSRPECYRILPDYLLKLFDVIVTGSDVSKGKPHPEPYLLALKQLGLGPGLAIAVENAPFGIQSAKSAGLKCLAVTTSLPEKYLAEADAVYKSIADLRGHIIFTDIK